MSEPENREFTVLKGAVGGYPVGLVHRLDGKNISETAG